MVVVYVALQTQNLSGDAVRWGMAGRGGQGTYKVGLLALSDAEKAIERIQPMELVSEFTHTKDAMTLFLRYRNLILPLAIAARRAVEDLSIHFATHSQLRTPDPSRKYTAQ
jgi:hypothetical protein